LQGDVGDGVFDDEACAVASFGYHTKGRRQFPRRRTLLASS
jgi:hypothetical protein